MNRGNLCVATWNTKWATERTDRGQRIASIIKAADADIVVLTEGTRKLFPANGFVVDAGADWGYDSPPHRRKVIIWSRFPLTPVAVPNDGAARGRLAAATAVTPDGPVRIVGVCIPWKDAHVHTGRVDTRPWAEHLEYLDQLAQVLSALDGDIPTVVAGDFNQRIPRVRQPRPVAEKLGDVFRYWTIHTTGPMPNGPHIDHIATNRGLSIERVYDWPASDHTGTLSDHAGVACHLAVRRGMSS
jgi:endonuclease/exonuclease/phosphatase family metal-dependent hydrolase